MFRTLAGIKRRPQEISCALSQRWTRNKIHVTTATWLSGKKKRGAGTTCQEFARRTVKSDMLNTVVVHVPLPTINKVTVRLGALASSTGCGPRTGTSPPHVQPECTPYLVNPDVHGRA